MKTLGALVILLVSFNAYALKVPTCYIQRNSSVVPLIQSTKNYDPAFSTLDPKTGAPEIFVNPVTIKQYESSPYTVTFIVEHECGHINLGHLYGKEVGHKETNEEELAADCYAAQAVRSMGMNASELQKVIADVSELKKDPDHPSGAVRARNILACYNNER